MAGSYSELGATLRGWRERLPPRNLVWPSAPADVRAGFAARK